MSGLSEYIAKCVSERMFGPPTDKEAAERSNIALTPPTPDNPSVAEMDDGAYAKELIAKEATVEISLDYAANRLPAGKTKVTGIHVKDWTDFEAIVGYDEVDGYATIAVKVADMWVEGGKYALEIKTDSGMIHTFGTEGGAFVWS